MQLKHKNIIQSFSEMLLKKAKIKGILYNNTLETCDSKPKIYLDLGLRLFS